MDRVEFSVGNACKQERIQSGLAKGRLVLLG